mgnify:CR=1 FL=1
MNNSTPPALFNLPVMCNVADTLSLYESTGLNFMNEKKTKIIAAWISPDNDDFYFVWYVDNKSSTHWLAHQNLQGATLQIMRHHPLDHWQSFVSSSGLEGQSVRRGTTSISRAFISYYTFNPERGQLDTPA